MITESEDEVLPSGSRWLRFQQPIVESEGKVVHPAPEILILSDGQDAVVVTRLGLADCNILGTIPAELIHDRVNSEYLSLWKEGLRTEMENSSSAVLDGLVCQSQFSPYLNGLYGLSTSHFFLLLLCNVCVL